MACPKPPPEHPVTLAFTRREGKMLSAFAQACVFGDQHKSTSAVIRFLLDFGLKCLEEGDALPVPAVAEPPREMEETSVRMPQDVLVRVQAMMDRYNHARDWSGRAEFMARIVRGSLHVFLMAFDAKKREKEDEAFNGPKSLRGRAQVVLSMLDEEVRALDREIEEAQTDRPTPTLEATLMRTFWRSEAGASVIDRLARSATEAVMIALKSSDSAE